MNSLLQGLSACPSFIKWLEGFTFRDPAGQSRARQQSLSLTLLRLLKALSCQEATEDDLLDASCLLEVLRLYRWQISSFEEQDAHELFHVLTSSLEEEQEGQSQIPHLFDVHSLEQPEIPQDQICCRTRGPLHLVPNRWKYRHPFHGRLTSNMVCKHCKHQNQAGGAETGQMMENQRTTFVKQLKLGKMQNNSPTYVYRLMAVVVHHGDMHAGHFVTYRRSPSSLKTPPSASNQWLWISDDSVRKTTLREVLSSSAYLLFYERIRSRLQHQSRELQAEE